MKAPFQILINHIGYDVRGSKRVVVKSADALSLRGFSVVNADGLVVLDAPLRQRGSVPGWKDGLYHEGDFSAIDKPGVYRIRIGETLSEPFTVREAILPEACLADVSYYFKIQRCSGVFDKADRSLPFFGEPDRPRVDVHGGWYDASGDVSKYLSHLSEANFMNPQQAPLVVWAMLEAIAILSKGKNKRLRNLIPLLSEEAIYGADFLVRMQDPEGYFHASVMDGCSHDPAQREICGYKGLAHVKHGETRAAFREGGGMTIAALARISTLKQSGDYPPERYLAAAEKGFAHLLTHNEEYCDDHRENILDDYCALMAATELFNATAKQPYLEAARSRAGSLARRIATDEKYSGWWRADDGKRPFFHTTDAGLPVVALLRYIEVEADQARRDAAAKAVIASLGFELRITSEVINPLGYPRQYVKDLDGTRRGAFFCPHTNETGFWWQGENARLGSLAAAALLGSRITPAGMTDELRVYARNLLNWILGMNPLDMCMLKGKGRNYPADYAHFAPGPSGGICNGFTSGLEDEADIAFAPDPDGRDWRSWRWVEQWIPHTAWFVLALAAEATVHDGCVTGGARQ